MFPPSRLGRERGPDADGAIRQTDTDAVLARLSAVKKGYIEDPFITHLIPRAQFQPARPPLINIGTYVRSKSIDALVDEWLGFCEQQDTVCQIVSLGAGSDTRFWRISTGPRSHVLKSYLELDFPDIVTKKAMAIRKSRELSAVLGSPENIIVASGGTALHSSKYHLLSCDLRHPPSTSLGLMLDGLLSPSLPTLLLFECVIFGAIVYEMFGLQDAFGQVMLNNLQSRNVSLPGAAPYPTVDSLPERFTRHGFTFSHALTLSEVREKYIGRSELERISHLELLDEVEELNLVLKHYAITWGARTFMPVNQSSPWGQWGLKIPQPLAPSHD
ncbi:S-adenosyl-L-methionine-dependent methyltransferase [Boletus coccyginus]|nr:S-adenosyl-L-methionine-dependent methyltransferase [Boletus coccyginus]